MITGADDIVNFCVLTTPRSGSTWFLSLLNSHPDIGTFGEAFLNKKPGIWADQVFLPADRFCQFRESTRWVRPWSTFRYLDALMEEFSAQHRALGFKLMYKHLLRYLELLPLMLSEGYRIIHLVRTNYLDVLISERIVQQRGRAHARAEVAPPPVHLEPSTLVRILRGKRRKVKIARLVLRSLSLDVIEVDYESLCEDTPGVLDTTTGFLSVPLYAGYQSCFRKISRKPDWERIRNYEQVRRALDLSDFRNLVDSPESSNAMSRRDRLQTGRA